MQLFASGLQTDEVYFPSENDERRPRTHSGGSLQSITSITGLGSNAKKKGGFADPFKIFSTPSKAEAVRQVEEMNAEQIMIQIDSSLVERVFTTSVHLSAEAIQDFVLKLCEVSKYEVSATGAAMEGYRKEIGGGEAQQPRIFSLQKIVEVADFNMTSRSRLVWANVWEVSNASCFISNRSCLLMFAEYLSHWCPSQMFRFYPNTLLPWVCMRI